MLVVQPFGVEQREPREQTRVEPVAPGVLVVVVAQVRRALRRHQHDTRAAAAEPGGERHPGVARGFQEHQHLGVCSPLGQHRPQLLEPGVVAAVDLEQHPLARHALAPHAVPWRAAPPRAGHAGPRQDAPYRRAAEAKARLLLDQLGEVGVVGAPVARGGEAHDGSRDGLGNRVVGASAAVAVGERLGAELPVGGKQPADVAFAEVHQLSRQPDRDLLGEDTVEYMKPCLFLLVQGHFLHGRTDSLTS